jgi:nucleoside-diphosphate-sugar epimerase
VRDSRRARQRNIAAADWAKSPPVLWIAPMAKRALLVAGNGFIGSRTAVHLAQAGFDVAVHHTGRRPLPKAARVRGILAPRSDPPISDFPNAATAFGAEVVIHFLCMGEKDAAAFLAAFDGKARRLVLISSCDVYRAYGRFTRLEPGPPDPTPLDEDALLRTRLYPYRAGAPSAAHLHHWYEKLDAERVIAAAIRAEIVILRLAKVYGPGANLDTVFGFSAQPNWRWTHGHVENVAAAIACAATHAKAAGEIFNVGERETPTMGERLAQLPQRAASPPLAVDYDFTQDLHFRTEKIRDALG